ncbi:sulfite exporter TauE/SafE family protein [Sinomicrobium weinanense]|uniref:Probable membrane transporter protein n=1 Tax=Sinomicrobium weinanense TaxID=2842200 RepID=A0A926JPQ8_9FLAO|nr:sulfite exporter TauE/SafE family protein [Sinomicrobium weinanense]MBC9795063.1 sulfite exporter TauE/SafE family protein [Sinomicrobium weinanense]MBU3123808.1 sulfite exporter TauE/SafE family protein [Sinomicrobium weinanense]
MDTITFYILSIFFIATLVRSTFGFGESLVAVPLLILLIPLDIAVPLSVLISITIALVIVVQDRKQIHLDSAKWLIVFAFLGIPIGLLLLIYGNETFIKCGLGLFLILYAIYSMVSTRKFRLASDNKVWLFVCGFLSGVFGGAYGINGPPLVVYGNMRNWTAKHFRATLQAYFLPAGAMGMLGYWYKGLWSPTVTHYFFIVLPVVIPAIFIGRSLNRKLSQDTFLNYIYTGLIAIGLLLLYQSL